jgi:hypothetical protein
MDTVALKATIDHWAAAKGAARPLTFEEPRSSRPLDVWSQILVVRVMDEPGRFFCQPKQIAS